MQIVKKIIIDLSRKGTANVIDAVQYDVNTRVVEITLLQNGIPWNVPDGVTAAVGYKKSDGTRGLYDQLPDNSKAVSISGNVITAILVGQVLTVSGMVKASILMHDSNLNQLTTFPFDVNVVPNPSGTEEVSNDYYKYTTMQAVSDAVDAWLTETSEKQDTFLEAGSKALEVIKETINDGEDAPPIICAANGEVIAVSDASDRLFRGLHIYGKTTQNGTPTPDTPVPLETVGADGNVAVTVCGKNLLPYPYYRQEISGDVYVSPGGVTFTANKDGSVTMSGTNTATSQADREYAFTYSKNLWLPAGTYTMSTGVEPVTDASWYLIVDTYSGSIDGGAKYVRGGSMAFTVTKPGQVFIALRVNENKTVNNVTVYPQLEVGSIATAYEKPITNQTLTVQTPTGLPGIPVSSGGNYTDENGQMWICDEIDFARGKYVKRIGTKTFKGTEAFTQISSNLNCWRVVVPEMWTETAGGSDFNTVLALSCSHFKPVRYKSASQAEDGTVTFYSTGEHIIRFTHNSKAVPEYMAEQYDSGNPVKVLYKLAVPTETNLTAEELAQYSALHTNYPNTTIYNDEGVGMGVKYVADTKLYIDHKFNELSHAILNNA